MSTKTNDNELKLLNGIARGNESDFQEIFIRYRERFFAAAFRMTRSADAAEEIVQEIFVTLWLNRKQLASVESPSSYLFSIAYHSIYAHFRKMAYEKKARMEGALRMYTGEHHTMKRVEQKEEIESLEKLIRHLPPQQQIILRLSKEESLSRDEIARRLNISPNTVRNHLYEAIKYIRMNFNKAISVAVAFFWI